MSSDVRVESNHQIRPAANGWFSRERLLTLTLVAASLLILYVCLLLVKPFLPALTWALALAVVAGPVHEWLRRRIQRRDLAAGLAVFVVTLLIIGPGFLLLHRLVDQAGEGIARLEDQPGPWSALPQQLPRLAPLWRWAESHLNVRQEMARVQEALRARLPSLLTGSLWAVAQLLVSLFALFYFFRDRGRVLRGLRSLVPLSHEEADEVFQRVRDTVYGTVYGHLAVAGVQGLLGGLMFWWLGLPAPVLWGFVMALAAVVPVLGPFVVWVPAAVYLVLDGSWGKGLILTAWGTLVVSLIDNLLYPILVGNRMRLHTLPVFLAIVGGLIVFGAAGLVLGPVVLALAAALVDIWRRRTAGGQTAEEAIEPG